MWRAQQTKVCHQSIPSSNQSETNESVDVAPSSQLAANDHFDFQTCKIANTEKFEEYIDQARTSEDIASVDQWWKGIESFQ